ncbi:hypothetical protein B296_00006735 [Ensete ventricosum]|uniref:Uncharacterized protein n=1 Tax=Ensete ventricosum TaxID=4639 RepID=A0A426Z449_ENSVE|nr:hypothetical protein B296_00006735 [Ensete ventricosum]
MALLRVRPFWPTLSFWVAEPLWTRRRFLAPFDHLLQHLCVLRTVLIGRCKDTTTLIHGPRHPIVGFVPIPFSLASLLTTFPYSALSGSLKRIPAFVVSWHSLLEPITLLVVMLFTKVELPVAPDHTSHAHIPHETSSACVVLPRTIPPRSIVLYRLLVISPLHSDSCRINSDYDLSMCSLCQHIVGPPPPPIVLAPLAIDLRPPVLRLFPDKESMDSPSPSSSQSPQASLKLVHHFLNPGPLSPTSTTSIAYRFLHDNLNGSIMTYFSRVPTSASSCPVLRPFDPNFASTS